MKSDAYVRSFLAALDSSVLDDADFPRADVLFGAAGIVLLLTDLLHLGFVKPARVRQWITKLREFERHPRMAAGLADGHIPAELQHGFANGTAGSGYSLLYAALALADRPLAAEGIRRFSRSWDDFLTLKPPTTELFGGAAGFSLLSHKTLASMPEAWLDERRELVRVRRESRKLVFERLETPLAKREDRVGDEVTTANLGFAHGIAGELYSVACTEPALPSVALDRLNELCVMCMKGDGVVAWPSNVDGPVPHNLWPALCNGTPGMLLLFSHAAAATGRSKYFKMAKLCAETTFQLPVAASNVCCGVSGQLIALDVHGSLCGDAQSRQRARYRLQQLLARTSDAQPPSFYKGLGGVVWCAARIARRRPLVLPILSVE